MNAPQPTPRTVQEWLRCADDIRPQWRARRVLRETLLAAPDLQEAIDATRDARLSRYVHRLFDHPYWSFEPRQDNIAEGDEQQLYFESNAMTTVCLGGNGCLAGWEEVFDPVASAMRRLDAIAGPFHVLAKRPDTGELVAAAADAPWVKGVAPLYRWTLANGAALTATDEHLVVSARGGWTTLRAALADDLPVWCENRPREWSSFAPGRRREPPLWHPPLFERGAARSARVVSREFVGELPYYDFEVPGLHNYHHKGTIAANSGKSFVAAQRLIKFCCEEQPPPMRDTPFLVIAVSLEEAQRTCWTQHLYGLLPEEWVDWNRIVYESRKMNFPRIVPLMPWAGAPDRNWTLYFCGYSQDRAAFQSVAAGGAWFTEQCDYEIYEEVLFRMRRYMYPGSIWMEFTPIDPSKSKEIKEKYEDWCSGKVDHAQWQFARLSTVQAAKAGHAKQEIVDQAKASMSDDVLATRLYGVFAGYKGSVYKDFSSRVHLIPNEYAGEFEFNPDCIHKRGVDWGSGPENAFVFLWGQKDTMGRWWIYDEYYTTEQNTWEDRAREIHRKDGWNLVAYLNDDGKVMYRLEPLVDHPRWQYGVANFQQTYGPQDDPGLFREMGKYQIPVTRCKQGYEMGIDAVTRCLKFDQKSLEAGMAPHLFIDRVKCPNLAWELPALQWQEMPHYKTNPRAVKRYQKKVRDHSCCIGDLPVLTARGWSRIVDIRAGEIVASRGGWSRVITGGTKTRSRAELVELRLSTGDALVCTPDHELLTPDGDWLRADEAENRLLTNWDAPGPDAGASSSWLSATESFGDDTRSRQCRQTDILSLSLVPDPTSFCCTAGFTNTTSAIFPLDSWSITSTATCPTIARAISRWRQTASTCAATRTCMRDCGRDAPLGRGPIPTWSANTPDALAGPTGPIRASCSSCARLAACLSRASTCATIGLGIVPGDAARWPPKPSACFASGAARSFTYTPASMPSFAVAAAPRVLAVTRCGRADTYCIAVERGSMVWPGGVVAKNCDALRGMIYSDWIENSAAGTTGFWRTPKERPQVRHSRERRR